MKISLKWFKFRILSSNFEDFGGFWENLSILAQFSAVLAIFGGNIADLEQNRQNFATFSADFGHSWVFLSFLAVFAIYGQFLIKNTSKCQLETSYYWVVRVAGSIITGVS